MSSLVQILLGLMTTFVVGSAAVTTEIIEPIRASGDEVALIFVPGAFQRAENYREIAKIFQEASNLRMWVALTGGYNRLLVSLAELPGAIDGAINALKQAGMVSENYVGIGHSLGGLMLGQYARNSTLKAIILMGSYVTYGLSNYPIPVLTLAGELDGRVRITKFVDDFENIFGDVSQSKEPIYRTPIVNIKGTNHMQFQSGPTPPTSVTNDLKPDLTDAEAHKIIGQYVNNFATATFSSEASEVRDAQKELENMVLESSKRFQPLKDMKALQAKDDSCPWAITSQQHFGEPHADTFEIKNYILELPMFVKSTPSFIWGVMSVTINNTAFIEFEDDYMRRPDVKQSPKEISLKLKSRDAIFEELSFMPEPEPSCRALNELARDAALNSATDAEKQRYKSRGRPIVFEDDILTTSEDDWNSTPLKTWEDSAGLHVQSVALVTAIDADELRGMHYCRVMAPYRALEWIIIDSLRD